MHGYYLHQTTQIMLLEAEIACNHPCGDCMSVWGGANRDCYTTPAHYHTFGPCNDGIFGFQRRFQHIV